MPKASVRTLAVRAVAALVSVAAAGGSRAQAATITMQLAGSPRPVTTWMLGLNGQNTMGPTFTNTKFAQALGHYGPGTLRYPGGTNANFWSWRDGWYQPNGPWPGEPKAKVDNTLSSFASIIRRTGATPVVDVNVVTWQGRIAADADVPAMITDTLALLRAARSLGMPVRRVELGNELYLSGPGPGDTEYARRFATAGAYATVANRLAAAVHAEFPTAAVAAVAADTSFVRGVSPRRAGWNAGLLPNLTEVDAVTFHQNRRVFDADAAPAEVLGVMFRDVAALRANELDDVRARGLSAWITEFNMADTTPGFVFTGTWLHGLCAAVLPLLLLRDPAATQAALHNMTGKAHGAAIFRDDHGFLDYGPRTTPYALTSQGHAVGIVQDALRGAATTQPVAFPNGPPLGAQNAPGLLGMVTTAGAKRRVIVLNLTSQTLTLDVSPVLSGGFAYRVVRAPVMARIARPSDMTTTSGTGTRTLPMPAYAGALLTS